MDPAARTAAPLALHDLDWAACARHPLPPDARRVLRYMQDIESHTIVYLRTLLASPAIDDPEVAAFLARWFHEETAHGDALARVLRATGDAPVVRRRSRPPLAGRLQDAAAGVLARAWSGFPAVHMVWGAINELTTLTGYRRLAARVPHPLLGPLLDRIVRQESAHFGFYWAQAARRLAAPRTARVVRAVVRTAWAPVGSGVQPDAEVRFVGRWLFGGPDGRAAARRVDATIRRLPGMAGAPLVEAWLDRYAAGDVATPAGGPSSPYQRAHVDGAATAAAGSGLRSTVW